jgi:hypothetical protein
MTTHLTISDRPLPASAPERAASGCSTAPAPWAAGRVDVTCPERLAANEAAAALAAAATPGNPGAAAPAWAGSAGNDATRMTGTQRAALAALIHPPATRRTSRWERRDRVGDVAWALVLALLLGLSVDSMFEGLRFVRTADALQTMAAMRPHAAERVAQAPSSAERNAAAAPPAALTRAGAQELAKRRQSSGVVSRTM